jgi:hypothetical protein
VNLSGRKLWRKQILPNDSINYQGRQIRFDTSYHKELVRNFRAGAYPQVPFQLADATNTHTNDPERTRGELVDLRAEPDGLYGYFALSDPSLVLSNPKLGVSCRILEDYTREHDNRFFGRALQHVLGTLDPKITGMKPWESVELASAQVDSTVDLASQDWTSLSRDGGQMPDEDKHVVQLSTAQLDRLTELLDGEQDSSPDGSTTDADNADADNIAQLLDPSWFEDSDDEGEDEFVDLDEEQEDDEGDEQQYGPQTGDVALAAVASLERRVVELTNKLGSRDSVVERAQLAATGLAPSIIDAAMPLLQIGPQAGVLQLSNGEQSTVAEQARLLLRRVLELSNRGLDVVRMDGETGWGATDEASGLQAQRSQQLKEMDEVYGR